MASRYWLWCCGWEVFGEVSAPKYNVHHQDSWGRGGSTIISPSLISSGQRSGKGGLYFNIGGGVCAQPFTGHVVARSLDYIFWCGAFQVVSFNTAPSAGDIYVIGNCHTAILPTSAYVAFIAKVISVGPPITVSFGYAWFDNTGALVGSWVEATTRTLPTAWVFLVIGHYPTTRETRLYIDSTTYSWSQVVGNAPYTEAAIVPTNRYVAGKSSDRGMFVKFDDFCCCEAAAWSGVPAADTCVILYQPNGNVSSYNNWTPYPTSGGRAQEHFRCWDDINQDPSESAADYLYPSATSMYDLEEFANVNAGTIEGVRLVAQSYDAGTDGPHKAYGKIGGATLQDLGLLKGGGYPLDDGAYDLTLKAVQLRQTPEASPVDWSNTKHDALVAGLYSYTAAGNDNRYRSWELAVLGVGSGLTMPAANPPSPYKSATDTIVPIITDVTKGRSYLQLDTLTPVVTATTLYRLLRQQESILAILSNLATVDTGGIVKSVVDSLVPSITDAIATRFYRQPDTITPIISDLVWSRLFQVYDGLSPALLDVIWSRVFGGADNLNPILTDAIKARLLQQLDDIALTLTDLVSARLLRQQDSINPAISEISVMVYDLVMWYVVDSLSLILLDRMDLNRLRWTRLFNPTELAPLPPGVAAAPSALLARAGVAGLTPAQGQGQVTSPGRADIGNTPRAVGSTQALSPGQGTTTSCDDQVSATSDDGFEVEVTGAVQTTNSTLVVSSNPSADFRSWSLLRFITGPFPPQGSKITAAYLSLYPYSTAFDDARVDIHGEVQPSPLTVTPGAGNYNITSRVRTVTSIPWLQDGLGVGWRNSPSIVDVVQEMVNACTPSSMAFILKPHTDLAKNLFVRDRSYSTGIYAAKLHLEWEPPMQSPAPGQGSGGGLSGGQGSTTPPTPASASLDTGPKASAIQLTSPPASAKGEALPDGDAKEEERWP